MVLQNVEKPSPVDDVFDALRHKQRRRILYSLIEHESRRELSIVDLMNSGKYQGRQWVALYHNHLPKLNELGYIEWERESCTIGRGPQFDEIIPFIRSAMNNTNELSK